MRFLLDPEQRAFAASLDALLTAADTPAVVREWSRGDHASGRALWSRLAEAGVFALAVPEAYEGLGPRPVELAVAFMELGRHAVPGPLVETVTAAVLLAEAAPGTAKRLLPALASGETMATVTPPRAQDAAVANDTPMPRAPQDAGVGDGTPAPRAQDAAATAGTPAPRAQDAKVGNGAPEPRAQAATATAGTPAPRAQDATVGYGAPEPRAQAERKWVGAGERGRLGVG
ncbi:acyl-CoA dehydrogenase family protein, partial [Streptomyces sp. NPDC006129]|uniref:acyl-CoA dehydrogenase family protein n=1 Tax=Streptomyces sp. NPDC006129 TaxID=3155348 RepID=UPI0033A8C9F5